MARKGINVWTFVLVALAVFFLLRVVRENYDPNYPGASMNIVSATIDSSNNLIITVNFTFTPPVDPSLNPPPRVHPYISSLQAVVGGQVVDLVPSDPKSVPPRSPIRTDYSATLPSGVNRNDVTQINASGYINFTTNGGATTYGTTPTVSDSTQGIRLI